MQRLIAGIDRATRMVEQLLALAREHRIDTFVLWARGDEDDQLAQFAVEVVPAVRAAEATS